MNKIKGKQIKDNSISNKQIYIDTDPIDSTDAINKDFLMKNNYTKSEVDNAINIALQGQATFSAIYAYNNFI